jgi:hypothetical protein
MALTVVGQVGAVRSYVLDDFAVADTVEEHLVNLIADGFGEARDFPDATMI